MTCSCSDVLFVAGLVMMAVGFSVWAIAWFLDRP